MIVTVTLNPAIDFHITMEDFVLGKRLSAMENYFFAGGKGINVSRVLKNIGLETKALTFLGGFTGKFVEDETMSFVDPIYIQEKTRINTKIKTPSYETEISGVAPLISSHEFDQLLTKIEAYDCLDALVLSGSLPTSLSQNTYKLIAESVSPNTKIILDTRGEALKESLAMPNIFLIKPNKDEIGEFFNCEIKSNEEALKLATELKKAYQIQHLIVSLGSEGAYFLENKSAYFAEPLKGSLISSVGAGDSLVAGFVGSFIQSSDPLEAFAYGIACGAGTAFSHGLTNKETADRLFKDVKIVKIY
ncbi:MAG: 1-phosphofructokinase family hexose kinase [Brevinema sp.]